MKRKDWMYGILLIALCLCSCGKSDEVLMIGTKESEAVQSSSEEFQRGEDTCEKPEICVYICGAVWNPGVVKLRTGDRIVDALEAAGGFTPEADETAVNLAKTVEDGEQIVIRTKEESNQLLAKEALSGLVDLNHADVGELCTLPGIGEAKAKDIIAYRQKAGGFRQIEEIMQVPGIKEAAFQRMKEYLTVQ